MLKFGVYETVKQMSNALIKIMNEKKTPHGRGGGVGGVVLRPKHEAAQGPVWLLKRSQTEPPSGGGRTLRPQPESLAGFFPGPEQVRTGLRAPVRPRSLPHLRQSLKGVSRRRQPSPLVPADTFTTGN